MKFEGAWTAIITPFDEKNGIDWDSLQRNIEFQISAGVTGVVPVGTTGESPTLSWEEHCKVIEKTVEFVKGRCSVIAGTGSNSTQEAVSGSLHAAEAGADGVLLVDCYYNGPSSLELRTQYYGQVAQAVPETAVVPYIIPGRTGTALLPEDVAILSSEHPNVQAVKEATGDLERMARTRRLAGDEFDILSGDDDMTFDMMTREDIRASGVISVISNVVPHAVSRFVQCILDGETENARKLLQALDPLFKIVTVKCRNTRKMPDGSTVTVEDKFRNPLAIKTLMAALGFSPLFCRKPLGRLSRAGAAVVRNAVLAVWDRAPGILTEAGKKYGVDVEARIKDDKVWEGVSCE